MTCTSAACKKQEFVDGDNLESFQEPGHVLLESPGRAREYSPVMDAFLWIADAVIVETVKLGWQPVCAQRGDA